MGINDRLQDIADTVAATRADVGWIRQQIQEGEEKIKANRDRLDLVRDDVRTLQGRWRAITWTASVLSIIGSLLIGVWKLFGGGST